MIILGLTGSIGMGKSTTARLFAEEGAAVHDADAAVHALYGPGGAAVGPVSDLFTGALGADGGLDRRKLGATVAGDAPALARLEALVHPLVAADRTEFLEKAKGDGAKLVVLDLPLLFETGAEASVDAVAVVSAPEAVQRARVMTRPGMTEAKFEALLARQWPDSEKRARADFIIDTGRGIEAARDQVRDIVATLSAARP